MKRAAIRERYRRRKSICEKRKENSLENILVEHFDKRKRSNFCDFEHHTSAPIRKEKIEYTKQSKDRGEQNQAYEIDGGARLSQMPWKS